MKLKDLKNSYLHKVQNNDELNDIKANINFKPQRRRLPIISYALSGIFLVVIVVLLCIMFVDTARVTFLAMSLSKNMQNTYKSAQPIALETNVTKFDYYLSPNEEVIINIDLANEKQFEIVSVEINNVVYPNYTFLSGSDIDTIYLKYQCDDQSGASNIYINSIKYIDGTSIKECEFSGDRELNVAIKYPTPTISNLDNIQITTDRISFSITEDILAKYQNQVTIYCYYDGLLIESYVVNGLSYSFSNLLPGQKYQIIISGEFDLLDGNGRQEYILYNQTYQTNLPFTYSIITSSNSIDFICDYPVKIYLNGVEVGQHITGLTPQTNYYLTLSYTYEDANYQTILGPIKTAAALFSNVLVTKLTNGFLVSANVNANIEILKLVINDNKELTNFIYEDDMLSLLVTDVTNIYKVEVFYKYLDNNYQEVIYSA